ncbi:MAG: hypothetical protein HY060_25635 [Proteobacteria bacterium]|nr:hypothetical protein [Pseudomonadota bacterium]
MDELDQLAEQPNLDVRRAINTLSLEFTVENRKGFKKLRESLLEALRADQELHELQIKVPGHAKLLDVAVDPPEAIQGGLLYRVHLDFAAGDVDKALIAEIVEGDVEAEKLAAR